MTMNILWTVGIFAVASLVNVILMTVKSILTIKAGKQVAAIANAVCYGVYAIVLKQIGDVDLITTIIVMIITNYIGVLVSFWTLNKFKRDTMWVIEAIISESDEGQLREDLEWLRFSYATSEIEVCNVLNGIWETKKIYRIYSPSQAMSLGLKKLLREHDVTYTVIPTMNSL